MKIFLSKKEQNLFFETMKGKKGKASSMGWFGQTYGKTPFPEYRCVIEGDLKRLFLEIKKSPIPRKV